ncbi:hypothetical protein JB92DRAFT_3144261 [Gautieria morchelliformis]|nr:hypothetical protein JB92DRAFT_3144261 [Gautieria morchelliformis]
MDTLLAKLSDNGHITPSNALKDALLELIVIPTTLSAAEFHVGCGATHPETRMKVLFVHALLMKYNKGVNLARQERLTGIMLEAAGETFEAHGLTREIADPGYLTKDLVKTLGLPTTLGEVGVTEERQLDRIAEYTLTDTWGKTNPRRIDNKEQVREILRISS